MQFLPLGLVLCAVSAGVWLYPQVLEHLGKPELVPRALISRRGYFQGALVGFFGTFLLVALWADRPVTEYEAKHRPGQIADISLVMACIGAVAGYARSKGIALPEGAQDETPPPAAEDEKAALRAKLRALEEQEEAATLRARLRELEREEARMREEERAEDERRERREHDARREAAERREREEARRREEEWQEQHERETRRETAESRERTEQRREKVSPPPAAEDDRARRRRETLERKRRELEAEVRAREEAEERAAEEALLADAFAALELPPESTEQEVERAYRRAVKRLHPDRNANGDAEAFARVTAAVEVLRQYFGKPSTPVGA